MAAGFTYGWERRETNEKGKTKFEAGGREGVQSPGEPTRLVILRLLAEQELCVCELEEVMDISQPRISHHLKVLRKQV